MSPALPTLLTYTLHPTPLPAGGRGALRITVANRRATPVTCDSVTFTLPVGSAPSDCATTHDAEFRAVDESRWRLRSDDSAKDSASFTATPTEPLAPGERHTFEISGIAVGEQAGTARLRITELARGDGEAPRTAVQARPVRKLTADLVLSDFTPDHAAVGHDGTVVLSWTCTPPPAADYVLYYGDNQSVEVNGDIDANGNGRWTSPPLDTTTAFLIQQSSTSGGDVVQHTLTTAVTVTNPDMEVGNLSVNGTTSLLGAVQQFDAVKDLPLTRTAPTDGFLHGYIKTTDSGSPATLQIAITAPGADAPLPSISVQSTDPAGGDKNQDGRVFTPVPAGAHIQATAACDAVYSGQLVWVPLGTGALAG
ncbi:MULTISPECIES: hypothetical protein [Streptomycetaceae]|uniref:hypothetical protein n=1 Tax=Streptomycetaceae TaxID=2062 RepID=UPI00093F2461|nr:hypothetical protein [Streptomyces sp. CB02056]